MKNENKNIQRAQRKSVYADLDQFDALAQKNAYIEVTDWTNLEGFDVDINSHQKFSLTWGQYKALKKLVKELDKYYAE